MTICSDDVLTHLTNLGYTDAVNEINKLLNKDKASHLRWRMYGDRIRNFAKNFGVWDAYRSGNDITLEYEIYGYDKDLKELAENINGEFYESPEEDEYVEYDLNGDRIIVNLFWFELIMHLWINKYKDFDFDIYQSKLI
jgi:hypothetical protein